MAKDDFVQRPNGCTCISKGCLLHDRNAPGDGLGAHCTCDNRGCKVHYVKGRIYIVFKCAHTDIEERDGSRAFYAYPAKIYGPLLITSQLMGLKIHLGVRT